MKTFLRSLSRGWEFTLVVLFAFGLTMYGNALALLTPAHSGGEPPISTASLWGLLVEEIVLLAVLVAFLRVRGWSRQQVGFELTLGQTLGGLGLAALAYAAYVVVFVIAVPLAPETIAASAQTKLVADRLDMTVIVAISVVNPVFEEFFLCGYVMTALREYRGGWLGLHVSVAIRVLCHLYQGPLGVLSIVPLGLAFGIAYLRTGKLWPLIVAHALLDLSALMESA